MAQLSAADTEALIAYSTRIGDDALILSHRLAEMCAHAPELEEDIALTNIALDLIGQTRVLYSYAAELENKGRDEDKIAFLREERDYRNLLLLEQPNEDFAHVIARQFLFSAMSLPFFEALASSTDDTLRGVAEKAVKEVRYHLSHAAQWVIRLGDGTAESHARMQAAIDALWMYTGEMFVMDDIDRRLLALGIGVDLDSLRPAFNDAVGNVLDDATLTRPADGWMASGGRSGRHTEYMGFILTELQYMQRTYPDMTW
ncbi:1,2-phenylacetyl-CoA epoxidase subunit PaaC [Govanella unica]|uniref:Phenylacetate-CoA oxygenase subunit PaaC n=1 Tax=Govanella unica TaxID=2975056 RepID=A0A9X3U003_9PROT|nr:1,2-phenylacetyl-CoA epoxidase subunit PaaC [Govania unica]MDA5194469.1 phenylacetate-CoA oxygenase subunit PaaC [Govania unica]